MSEAEEYVKRSFPSINSPKPRQLYSRNFKHDVKINYIMNSIPVPGSVTILVGRSGWGKTYTASVMSMMWARQGYGIYHNLPMEYEHENYHRCTTLSSLTHKLIESPMKRRNITFMDEANLTMGGSLGGSSVLKATKEFTQNFGRKLGNTSFVFIFQDIRQPAPIFRKGGVLYAVIEKTRVNEMRITYEDSNRKPIIVKNIPLPQKLGMKVYSHGASSFTIDYSPEKMDRYVAKNLKGAPSQYNFRKCVREFLINEKFETTNSTSTQFLRKYITDKYDKGEPLESNEELAKISGLKPQSVPVVKSRILKELELRGD